MKLLKSIIVIILLQTINLFGQVEFKFIYPDELDALPSAKADVEAVGRLIGSYLDHDATVVIKIIIAEQKESFLAQAPITLENIDGFQHVNLTKRIVFGKKDNDIEYDGIICINFEYPFAFGDNIPSDKYDFKAVIFHEMTHLLGFISVLALPCVSLEELESRPEKIYFFFDKFITTKNNNRFFDEKKNTKTFQTCLFKNSNENQLYFAGPKTLKYIGFPIPLASKDTSHIHMDIPSIMNTTIPGKGALPFVGWDDKVTAILLDLGYKVDNHWTRAWGVNESKKEKSSKKKKSKKKKTKKKKESRKSKSSSKKRKKSKR